MQFIMIFGDFGWKLEFNVWCHCVWIAKNPKKGIIPTTMEATKQKKGPEISERTTIITKNQQPQPLLKKLIHNWCMVLMAAKYTPGMLTSDLWWSQIESSRRAAETKEEQWEGVVKGSHQTGRKKREEKIVLLSERAIGRKERRSERGEQEI